MCIRDRNNVGGYMPSQPMAPKVENNKPNSALYALSRGYVVASPATRGRTNKASDGNFIGKAPAVIVDLQAATAYLHANDATMPGNAKRIITNGTSAGGADVYKRQRQVQSIQVLHLKERLLTPLVPAILW